MDLTTTEIFKVLFADFPDHMNANDLEPVLNQNQRDGEFRLELHQFTSRDIVHLSLCWTVTWSVSVLCQIVAAVLALD